MDVYCAPFPPTNTYRNLQGMSYAITIVIWRGYNVTHGIKAVEEL